MASTNVKYLKENKLWDAHKQFMRLSEAFGYPIEEEGEDDQQQDPNAMGGAPDPNMGGGPSMDGDPSGMGGAQDPSMGGDPSAMGGALDPSMGGDPSQMPLDGQGDDEETIDVDDLTKAQEKTNNKVNNVGRDLSTVDKRIEKLLGALEDMQGVIDKNNAEISDLKAEFEKRNPTQTEKLNLRSLDSYPFNVNPNNYWKQKGIDSNYEAYGDNSEPTSKEYVITNDDVDDIDSDIDKTFEVPEDMKQTFDKIFNNY